MYSVAKDAECLEADNEDSDQIAQLVAISKGTRANILQHLMILQAVWESYLTTQN